MSEVSLRILKMIDERKISVEEAHKLLVTIQAADHRYVESQDSAIRRNEKNSFLKILINENGKKIYISIR
jgi:hypothetical protein